MLSRLNPQQKEAVKYTATPLLVLAGAGSGKTSVIIEKISYLIEKLYYSPKSILAVTFTNKAAKEMQDRMKKRLDTNIAKDINISTFHSLGLNIIKKHYLDLGFKKNFSLLDSNDSLSLIHEIASEEFDVNKQTSQQIQSKISFWKSSLLLPSQVAIQTIIDRQAYFVYSEYQKYLKSYNCFDFDDLIFMPIQLLKSNKEVLEQWTEKFRYILIDEYQDTNESQYQILKLLTKNREKFTVVGDDDQSIYAWRGSRPENLKFLSDDFKDLKVIKLEQNYRSTGRILNVANKLIANNNHIFEKKLWSSKQYGDKVKVVYSECEESEAQFVSNNILLDKIKTNSKNKDYAILIRSNYQAFLIERYMQMHKLPYTISGGTSFFSKPEIKDIISYLRLIINPNDDRSFLRVINIPKRGIGNATIFKLNEVIDNENINFCQLTNYLNDLNIITSVKDAIKIFIDLIYEVQNKIKATKTVEELNQLLLNFLERINYKQYLISNSSNEKQAEFRYLNVLDFVKWIINNIEEPFNGIKSLSNILNKMLIIDMLDKDKKENQNAVQIITMHASKGLEFPKVYIMGMEEGLLPHQQSIEEENIEDERRLAYVAITRAKQNLTISLTKNRTKYGKKVSITQSRFIDELPNEDIEWVGNEKECPKLRIQNSKKSISALKSMFSY